jgi:hypothetical protein
MKKVSKFNAGLALGSLTAVVALFAGVPAASAQTATGSGSNTQVSKAASDNTQVAQTAPGADSSVAAGQAAPGGGSFPGSFLVPGTNTSLKIGGFAKLAIIYDITSAGGDAADVVAPTSIPLRGSLLDTLNHNFRFNPRQSTFFMDARTPTGYGELDTFIQADFFGQNVANAFNGSNTQNARLVLAYGTLGPLLGGQALTLWFDGDALGESVDPTASVGLNNGLTNRQPQVRYTYVAGGGLSAAISAEQPNVEGTDSVAGAFSASTFPGIPAVGSATNAAASQHYPDFVVKGRWDQAWGHLSLAALARNQEIRAVGIPAHSDTGWGVYLSGHLNTFGKDTLRGGGMVGEALGHYISDMGVNGGLETNLLTDAVKKPIAYGVNASYTHWWTDQLRSTVMAGYSHVDVDTSILSGGTVAQLAVQNGADKTHIGTTVNLVWSPVPQVDLGIEYDRVVRMTIAPAGAVQSRGDLNRVEAMTVFKF